MVCREEDEQVRSPVATVFAVVALDLSGAGARLFALRALEIALHESSLGPVHRRPAHPDGGGDLVVVTPASAASRICARLSFRAACLPPLRSAPTFGALILGQLDMVACI